MGSSGGHGPGSHPEAGAPSPQEVADARAPQPVGAPGWRWSCADHPSAAFSQPRLYYHPLYWGPQISKDLHPPSPPSDPDPHVQLAVSSRIPHRPMTLATSKTRSVILPQMISLLPPHLKFPLCLSPKPDTWESRQAHVNYRSASRLLCAPQSSATPVLTYPRGQLMAGGRRLHRAQAASAESSWLQRASLGNRQSRVGVGSLAAETRQWQWD